MATPSELIKLDVCLYKKDDVSYEDFIEWITKTYAQEVIPIMKKHGMAKWVQTVNPPHFREPFRQQLEDMKRPLWTVPDYDIVHTYYIRGHDVLNGLRGDPKWVELEEEALKFCNMSIGHIVIGHEIVHFENN
ncbi:hypothetical protein F4810DRAFT_103316 [Camillea tinctor]|nr:hypothetical protein F4810DRAFT_103316 [Camillea tinctor]